MDKTEIKKIVAEQLCNMIDNNIVRGWGYESFVGWLEDGDIFADTMTDEEINEVMEYVNSIAAEIDALVWKLAPENED